MQLHFLAFIPMCFDEMSVIIGLFHDFVHLWSTVLEACCYSL